MSTLTRSDASVDSGDCPVLLVDDQVRNLEVLEAVLASTGCEFRRAESADEALLALLERDFAAIICDIRMPGMTGLELIELVKKRKRNQTVPILFLTAHHAGDDDILRGYSLGAVDYLVKPVRPEILRSKVAVFLDLFRKERALEEANRSLQHEVVERLKAEEALRLSNLELEARVEERTAALLEADRRKDTFLATLSHELRNPLAVLRTAVDVLRAEGADVPNVQRVQEVLERQLRHMTRLMDDLLDVSRISHDKLVLQREPIDLSTVVHVAVESARAVIDRQCHTLAVELPPQRVLLNADPVRLAQLFSNLLDNAAKYNEPGGRIRVAASVEGGQVVVKVSDSGIGVDEALIPRMFDLFVQLDESRGRAHGGLGVGLSLARRLAEMHGGRLDAYSRGPGTGTELVVTLPAWSGVAATEPPAERATEVADSSPPLRVLVVDDNQDAADMLGVMVGALGHTSRVAYDGPEALTVAEEFRPHVMLIDIGLPGIDGYEVARRLREQAWRGETVLAALTGWGQAADRRRAAEAGFDEHIVKPIEMTVLSELLMRCQPSARPVAE